MVDNKTDLERTVSRLREHGSFGLDMEFQRERTFRPRLQLVQVSTPDECLLIDPLAFDELDSLWDVVEDPSIEKIVHAGSQDMEIVFARSGKLPHNIFDTQIAAALLGLGDQIGYANLISRMLHRRLKKGETVTDWSIRPLSTAQVDYALDDVRYLHEIREKLWSKLASMGRETWLREETEHYEERRTYERDPQTLWARISRMRSLDPKGLSILRELAIWRDEDSGIWELPRLRGYTQSKLACWLALEHAADLADLGQLPRDCAARWRREAGAVARHVRERCWSERADAYVRADDGADELDAAVLLAGRGSFFGDEPARWNGTIDAIRARLGAGGPLVYRCSGMEQEEGAFVACSFWLAESLARVGRRDEAAEVMDGMVARANDVGLFAEEIDPKTGDFLGNMPLALSHLSLVLAADALGD